MMTRNIRRVIFYVFIILFLIISFVAVVYSKGWSFDFKKMRFVETGAIYLQTKPAGVKIYLNDNFQKQTLDFPFFSSVLFKNLKPDDYKIKIEKDGYFSWEKTLSVQPNIVTEAKEIQLFLKKPPVLETAFSEINPPAGETNFYFKNNGLLYKKENNKEIQLTIVPVIVPIKFETILSKQGKILIHQLSRDKILYYFNEDKQILDKISQGVMRVSFSFDGSKLLYQTEHEIWFYVLDKKNHNLINRSVDLIKASTWLGQRAYAAYLSGGIVKIAELDDRDQRNIVDFISSDGDFLYFDDDSNYLYFLVKKKLYKIQIQ